MASDSNFLQSEGRLPKGRMGLILAFLALIASALTLVAYRLWRGLDSEEGDSGRAKFIPPDGLTEGEAEARQDPDSDQDNIISGQPAYSRKQIARQTIFTILKLYLTQILYLLFLIIAIQLWSRGFPYSSQQAGLIALITLTIPALALTLWASTGKLPRARLTKFIRNFVTPAALSIAILGLIVYEFTLERTGDLSYAQNVLTYALVTMGLLLVLTIKPPVYLHLKRLMKSSWNVIGDSSMISRVYDV